MVLFEKFRIFAARFMEETKKKNIIHFGEAVVYVLLLVFFYIFCPICKCIKRRNSVLGRLSEVPKFFVCHGDQFWLIISFIN